MTVYSFSNFPFLARPLPLPRGSVQLSSSPLASRQLKYPVLIKLKVSKKYAHPHAKKTLKNLPAVSPNQRNFIRRYKTSSGDVPLFNDVTLYLLSLRDLYICQEMLKQRVCSIIYLSVGIKTSNQLI